MSRTAKFGWLLMGLLLVAVPVSARENLMDNSGSEDQRPFFWRAGTSGGDMIWATDQAHNGNHSLKIVKTATGQEASWTSFNQATAYWNGMAADTYTFKFWAMTDGVNTSPTGESGKIGMRWVIDGNAGAIIPVNQTSASSDWTEYTSDITLTTAPTEAYVEFVMGSDATGTVWVDQVSVESDPWHAEVFGGSFDTAAGWMNWTDGDGGFAQPVMIDDAHSGDYAVKVEELDENSDEMVYYSKPTQAEPNTKYVVGVYVKFSGANTNENYYPTDAIKQNISDRANLCFFFHRGDILNTWDLTGGDTFMYFDQRTDSTEGWVRYWTVVKSPEDASGFSMRARLNNNAQGTYYYDDFFMYKVTEGENVVENGDLETLEPYFWNEGSTGGTLTWDSNEQNNGVRSLKIEKTGTGTAASWISDNQVSAYWNSMGATTYTFSFYAKTSGVNTSPSSDSEKIGARWVIDGNAGAITPVSQTSADAEWTLYSSDLTISSVPTTAYVELVMGADATGTVWFDQIGVNSDPWYMEVFGGDADTPTSWMHWANDPPAGYAQFENVGEAAHSGNHVVRLTEADTEGDEMVFYSVPFSVNAGSLYEFSVFVKQADMSPLNDSYLPSNVIPSNIGDLANLCFFFHRGDIDNSWDLTGGDQFIYFQQVVADSGWTEYRGVAQAPEDATGASLRARFNSTVVGDVMFDDFSIRELTIQNVTLDVEQDPTPTVQLPTTIELAQNFPNPFNPETTISFTMPQSGKVSLRVFDLLGREVARLVDGVQSSGRHEVTFHAGDLATGVYFYALEANDMKVVRKMVLMK